MKILIINDYGVEVSGAETYIRNLITDLRSNNHEVRVLSSNFKNNTKIFYDYSYPAVNQKSILRFIPYVFNIYSYLTLKRVIQEYKPDLIHLNYIFYHTSPSILFALKNINTIMTIHAHEILVPVGLKRSKYCKHDFFDYCIFCTGILRYFPEVFKRYIFNKMSYKIKLFIAPSKYYFEVFKRKTNLPILQIYNGVPKTHYVKPRFKKRVLFAGRIDDEKGIFIAIHSMENVIRKFPNVKLIILGKGSLEKDLIKYIKHHKLDKNIIYKGYETHEKIRTYIINSDLVLIPSKYPDNLPTIGLESLSVGRPIIGSSMGGIEELISDNFNGYLVKNNNVDNYYKYIIKILSSNKTLLRLSLNSYKSSFKFTNQNLINLINNLKKY